MLIRGAVGAVVVMCASWVVMVAFWVAGPDSTLLRDLLAQAWGAVVDVLRWFAGANRYPQRAVLVVAGICGFMLGAKTGK